MENEFSNPNTGTGLGIAGLVLGIIALPLAILGCTSVFALVLAIVGVALSTVAYTQAKKVDAPTSLIIAGMVVSIIALGFSTLRTTNTMFKLKNLPWELVNKKLDNLEEDTEEFGKVFEEEFENELGGNLEDVLHKLEDELDELEENLDDITGDIEDSVDNITDKEEAARKLGRAAGRAVREFVDELSDTTEVHIEID